MDSHQLLCRGHYCWAFSAELITSHSSFPPVLELQGTISVTGVPVGARFFGEESRLARKTGQIVGRGRRRWPVHVFLGRQVLDAEITLNEYPDQWLENAAKPAAAGEKLPQL
jgi:hypothetical protein